MTVYALATNTENRFNVKMATHTFLSPLLHSFYLST